MGSSYDLSCVIDALAILKQEGILASLIVMGDGPKRQVFELNASNKGINALFVGRLAYNQMCSLLCECDITINPIMHKAAQSIINKHADYAASGLPVVSTQENEEYRSLVEKYNMGFNCKNNDPIDVAEKLRVLILDSELREKFGKNARKCAEERFNRKESYKKLCASILGKDFYGRYNSR